jgi:hypothetical protein
MDFGRRHDKIAPEEEKMTDKKEYIQTAAYYIWLDEGCPDGRDIEIWNEAARRYELAHMRPVCTKKECKEPAARSAVFIVSRPAARKETRADARAAFGVKKKPAKKPAAKPAAKKAAVKKPAAKKPAPLKTPAKKPSVKKAPAKKPAAAKAPAKKAVAKKKSIVVKMAPKPSAGKR